MSSHVETPSYPATDGLESFIASRNEPDSIRSLRRRALEKFNGMAWPTTQDEEWRRSDISFYDFDQYDFRADRSDVMSVEVPAEAQNKGVTVLPLASLFSAPETYEQIVDAVAEALETDLGNIEHRLQAWHYAMYNAGVVVHVPAGTTVKDPVRISFYADGDGELIAPHLFVVAEGDAEITVTYSVSEDEDSELLYNDGATFVLGDGARVRFESVHNLGLDSLAFSGGFAYLSKDSSLRHFTGAFGGMFAKHRTDVHVVGEGADAQINGLYFGREDQHLDLRTVQYHRAPHGGSRTFYKGAVQDEGRSVFQGLIEVAPGADQTDAYLTNNNLILNDGARADSIPSLQIQTDDVKCSHGSTTGKIDPAELYYLQTRGYSKAEATEIVVEGYFEEVAAKIDESLADLIRSIVHQRLGGSDE